MEKGLKFTRTDTVTENYLALNVGSGDLEVLATPAMAAFMENAAMNAVASVLDEGQTTVGSALQLTHSRPSGKGEVITTTATLDELDGRKLVFKVVSSDSKGVIGECIHVRYIVDAQRFMSKLK